MGKEYTPYKYVLFGIADNRPYWMGECVVEQPTGSLYPIPRHLVDKILAAAKAGAKYLHYFVVAFDEVYGATWTFQAGVVHPEPDVEWESGSDRL